MTKKTSLAMENEMSLEESVSNLLEENNVVQDHIQFVLDFQDLEELFGPASLPRRLLTDRENPLECLRPNEFR
jgi:hypothetical protein